MSDEGDIAAARLVLRRHLGSIKIDAMVLLYLQQRYEKELSAAAPEDLMAAAAWAGDRLAKEFAGHGAIEPRDYKRVEMALRFGCPLCSTVGGRTSSASAAAAK